MIHIAWEIEKKFESLSAWKSFTSTESKNRITVIKLARDSHMHRINLEKILKILNLDAPTNEIPEINFDFSGMLHSEIFENIARYDEMARLLYEQILENTDPKLLVELMGSSHVSFFYQIITKLIEDETNHIKMVKNISSKIERIQ